MKTADLHGSPRVIPYRKNCSSELAVIGFPLTAWGNLLNGFPMLQLKGYSNINAFNVYKGGSYDSYGPGDYKVRI